MNYHFYPSNLIPAVPNVKHGYKNVWLRDLWYIGLCSKPNIRYKIWQAIISILDKYKWKLEIHAKQPPIHWYEYFHVRYSPEGLEIGNEHWLHNQFDAIANVGEIALELGRKDLAELILDYFITCDVAYSPAAGMFEDRNELDSYTLACVWSFLCVAECLLRHRSDDIRNLRKRVKESLNELLPYATQKKTVCLSLLGVIWPCDFVDSKTHTKIINLVTSELKREPYGLIRYKGDLYSGHDFSRGIHQEIPWLLGDAFMAKIEPKNLEWKNRLKKAHEDFKCMPEAYFPENMKANRNCPLLWCEAMYYSVMES